MNKKLKEEMIRHRQEMRAAFPNLYDMRWVEKSADEGFKELVKNLKSVSPRLGEAAGREKGYNVIAVIYYTAFENALNTFFAQCMDDTMTSVELILDEFQKVTAELKSSLDGSGSEFSQSKPVV